LTQCWGRTRNLRRCGRLDEWKLFCNDHRFQPIIWLIFLVCTVGGGVASIQSAWFPQLRGKLQTARYRASFGTTLLSQSREETGGIWLCADHGSGRAMTPVNLATFVTIENLGEHATQITSLTVDIRGDGGPWVRLTRLDSTTSEILCCAPRASGLNSLGTVALTSGGLLGQLWHNVLRPHEPIADIAFFEYPPGYNGPGLKFEMKLSLRDKDGATFSVTETRNPTDHPEPSDPSVQPDRLKVLAPYKDYSSLPIAHVNP